MNYFRKQLAAENGRNVRRLMLFAILLFAGGQIAFAAHAAQHLPAKQDAGCVVCIQVSHGNLQSASPTLPTAAVAFVGIPADRTTAFLPAFVIYNGSARSPPLQLIAK